MSALVAGDTSVALPLVIGSHSENAAVTAWAEGKRLALSGHAYIEAYSVLTRLPGNSRVSAADAIRLLEDNFAGPLTLSPEAQTAAPSRFAQAGIGGGATYDALVALAAVEAGVALATRDARARPTYEALGAVVMLVL